MTSKVTAKLPLGVAFSMLLISLALFVGCKQDIAQDSYTPPGYGATVGYLTDTTWKSGNETIKFGAEGSVTVPDSMKKIKFGSAIIELGDFTYSVSTYSDSVTISAKVKKAPADLSGFFSEGDIIDVATCTIGTTASSGTTSSGDTAYGDSTSGTGTKEDYPSEGKEGGSASNGTQGSSTSPSGIYKYYQMKVSPELLGNVQTFTMENIPTSGDKFVGTYYNGQGVKSVQINKDGTFVNFSSGGKNISYWQDNGNGTISVKSEPFTNSPNSGTSSSTSSTTYYLYPHALMSNGSAKFYK